MSSTQIKQKTKATSKNFLNLLKDSQISFWIDSSGGPSEYCKNSFYGVNPQYYLYGYLNEVNLVDLLAMNDERRTTFLVNCFDFLEKKLKEEKDNPNGIFVGYFSYDLFKPANDERRTTNDEEKYPDFFFAYFDNVIARRPLASSGQAPQSRSQSTNSIGIASLTSFARNDMLTSNMTDAEYLEKVKLIKEEIKKGNVYQVSLTREYSIEVEKIDELDLYLKLREVSPNPYGCFFKTPFVTILSSSPEEFIFVKDGYIRTRPIKGTLPKNVFEIDPKNQAENIMIVDLERNDLGRICEYGSIKAEHLLEIEEYKHLNHVVSKIEGKLRPNVTLRQIFEAVFPGGSITGAPKIAAMKIIDRVEPTKRGAYTGSFGYIRTDGTMDFNILIRTIFIQNLRTTNDERRMTFNVGGGIVADSDPQAELEEIKLKVQGIISALCLSF